MWAGGICAFLCEEFTLTHAETVLFVGDNEAEIGDFDVFLDEGVGADDDFGCKVVKLCKRFPAFFGSLVSVK